MEHKRIELCHINLKENRGIKKFAVAFLKEVEEDGKILYHTIQIDRAKRKGKLIEHWALGGETYKKPTTQKHFVRNMGQKMIALRADAVALIYREEEDVK